MPKRKIRKLTKQEIGLLLSEEQTILSRERTMHSYMQTGLAFMGVGLLIVKYVEGIEFTILGAALALFGGYVLYGSMKRFFRYRKSVRRLRKIERKLRLDVGE